MPYVSIVPEVAIFAGSNDRSLLEYKRVLLRFIIPLVDNNQKYRSIISFCSDLATVNVKLSGAVFTVNAAVNIVLATLYTVGRLLVQFSNYRRDNDLLHEPPAQGGQMNVLEFHRFQRVRPRRSGCLGHTILPKRSPPARRWPVDCGVRHQPWVKPLSKNINEQASTISIRSPSSDCFKMSKSSLCHVGVLRIVR